MNSDNKPEKRSMAKARLYLFLLLCSVALTAALRVVAIFTCYDADIGYFMRGMTVPEISTVCCVLCCVAAVIFPQLFKKLSASSEGIYVNQHSGLEYFATAYAAFVMLGGFVYELYHCIADNTVGGMLSKAAALIESSADNAYAARSYRIQAGIIIIGIIASAVSAIYFLLRLNEKRSREWHVLVGFAPGLRGVSGLAAIYFDMTVEMNSPNKLILQAALISVMIYFVYELRMLLGGKKAHPRAYVASGLVAVALSASASIPLICGYFAGLISNSYFFTESFFCFNMMIYIAFRTISFIRREYLTPAVADESVPKDGEAAPKEESPTGSE
ncbi:MAG: hypothetical protein MR379_08385 [Clostridiales bacterium]|nr:hypothetical protein [Clostridiales bacterium]